MMLNALIIHSANSPMMVNTSLVLAEISWISLFIDPLGSPIPTKKKIIIFHPELRGSTVSSLNSTVSPLLPAMRLFAKIFFYMSTPTSSDSLLLPLLKFMMHLLLEELFKESLPSKELLFTS